MRADRGISVRVTACFLFFVAQVTSALEMPFLETNITNKDIVLRLDNVQSNTQPEIFTKRNLSFTGKKRSEELTLDERCARGLPLSVRWTNYGPYSSLVRGINSSVQADGVGLTGIFPSVINNVLRKCCHRNTRVMYGHYIRTLIDLEQSLSRDDSPDDIMFPVGLQSMTMSVFKKLPVVPLLVSPRTTLVVPDVEKQGNTMQLVSTVAHAWRILLFIFLAAIISGMFIWALDHITNPDEFPTKFSEGVWEGFWWAVVTMTTVGYGDRAPRSIPGRLFCIIWIVTGMSIVAIFTAMVTASLSASFRNKFVIHGSVMGCVDGSQEERIATGMSADIRTFGTPNDVITELVDTTNLEAVLMDSYLLTYYHEVIKREPVRVKQVFEQPVNYGLVMAPNSTNFTDCFTRYVQNYPQEIFNSIRDNYKPLKNPTDDVSEELKASQRFLQEDAFHMILYALAGFLAAFVLLGLIWEYFISKLFCRKRDKQAKAKKSIMESLIGNKRADDDKELQRSDINHLETIKHKSAKIRQLIREFDDFYEKWMEKLKEVAGGDDWRNFGKMTDKNESFLMVTYNGNQS